MSSEDRHLTVPSEDNQSSTSTERDVSPVHREANPNDSDPPPALEEEIAPPRYTIDPAPWDSSPAPTSHPLRYRLRTVLLLLIYIPLLVVPWALTCVLNERPLNASSYTQKHAPRLHELTAPVTAVRVLSAIAAVAALPVVSAVLAQAAVVYCQRRKPDQSLSLKQMFALADRGWADLATIAHAIHVNDVKGAGSPFFFLAVGLAVISELWCSCGFYMMLMLIGVVQPPLQQLLVQYRGVPALTCENEPFRRCGSGRYVSRNDPVVIGYDPEPGDMEMLPQNAVVRDVVHNIARDYAPLIQPHLWLDLESGVPEDRYHYTTSQLGSLYGYQNLGDDGGSTDAYKFFVAALTNGTTTGVLREHAMRLNSSIECASVPRSAFPVSCSGKRPLSATVSSSRLEARICVPGEYGVYPWTRSRNRQTLSEDMFVDVYSPGRAWEEGVSVGHNFTVHCRVQTSRGYFELGNAMNGYTYGPLLEEWPGDEEVEREFSDYTDKYGYSLASKNGSQAHRQSMPSDDIDAFNTRSLHVAGPLMTSAIALFGNASAFTLLANISNSSNNNSDDAARAILTHICATPLLPFLSSTYLASLVCDRVLGPIQTPISTSKYTPAANADALLAAWLGGLFNNTKPGSTAPPQLHEIVFFANRAALTLAATDADEAYAPRTIVAAAPATVVQKPVVSPGAVAVVSVLVALQVLGLVALAAWAVLRPSWTRTLDAFALARVGACVGGRVLGPLGEERDKRVWRRLEGVEGVVGVVVGGGGEGVEQEGRREGEGAVVRLGLGGRRVVERRGAWGWRWKWSGGGKGS